MRAVVVVAALGASARADPEVSVRDGVTRDGIEPAIRTSLRMRSEGAAAGVGVGASIVRGDYTLALDLMRWQTLDDRSQGSWELGVRGYRYFQLGPRTRAHVMAGASYELVERDGADFGRSNLFLGAGVSTKLADGLVGWMQLTLEHKHWVDQPPGLRDDDELAVMLMFGLSF